MKAVRREELRDRYADMRDVLKDLLQIKDNKMPAGPRKFRQNSHAGKKPDGNWIRFSRGNFGGGGINWLVGFARTAQCAA